MYTAGVSVSGFGLLLILQIIFVFVFGFYTDYSDEILPKNGSKFEKEINTLAKYPHFQDIHVMIFIGFAFLMTFLKRYGFSASGFNMLLGALIIQWAIIIRGCYDMEEGIIKISLRNLIGADIAAASVLISMGAILGRTTPIQLLVMGIIEIVIFASNEFLQIEMFRIADVGGSITVHAFGAYFGLAVSYILRPKKEDLKTGLLENSSYNSDMSAMIGTLFLWIFWPSFNSALISGVEQERAIINTYLSLSGATVTAFATSVFVSHEHKLDMVHVQNSTLAGGVAVGSICNLLIHPFGAISVGVISGLISVLGYRYLTPLIFSKLRIADTCGVHNLHGIPAIISALFSALFAAIANRGSYGESLSTIFPAMNELEHYNKTYLLHEDVHTFVIGGYGRTASKQGAYQLLGILITVTIAIVGGLSTGFILKSPSLKQLEIEKQHTDEIFWELPLEHNVIPNLADNINIAVLKIA